ncbi:MAG: penicillin-binding transpeptidase domain-containing protein [Candidatus Acidiferrales bacterium]
MQLGNREATLQASIGLAMAGRSGTAVVVDVQSGRILASYQLEIAAQRLVLPGSGVKPFTLRALLAAKAIRPETRFVCPLKLNLAGHGMDCSHPRMPQPMDAASALAHSCNNYFAQFATRLDDATLVRALEQAGLTSATGFVARETIGRVQASPTPERHSLKALGAADLQVTPLGLLSAYRRLALARRQGTSDDALQPVFAGLEASVNLGMAHAAGVEGMAVAGKTGTVRAAEGNWTHAWFAGYAPAERPEMAVVIFLERGTGAADASPIAQGIFEAFHRLRGQP